jgi:multidrug efflux pump subunit AcrA (membrane-fusion protein)
VVCGAGLALTLGICAVWRLDPSALAGQQPEEGPPEPAPRAAVSALGRIEPAGGIPIVGPPGDRIGDVLVEQRAVVQKDDILVRLASHADRVEELRLAEAQLAEAKGQLETIHASRQARRAEFDAEQLRIDVQRSAPFRRGAAGFRMVVGGHGRSTLVGAPEVDRLSPASGAGAKGEGPTYQGKGRARYRQA